MTVQVIEIQERSARQFPRTEIFDSSGRSLIFPNTRDLSAVDLRDTAEGITLRALGLIGYLPLTDTITLNIRPKFPLENLWSMVEIAEDHFGSIIPVVRKYQTSNQTPPHHMLIQSFCYYLSKILSEGIVRSYSPFRREGYYQPKVDFGKTLKKFIAKGDIISTASTNFSYSYASNANSFLKSGCLRILELTPKTSVWTRERKMLVSALDVLGSVHEQIMPFGGEYVVDALPKQHQSAYGGALKMYALLLGHRGIGFDYDGSGHSTPSFLFKLDDIFESFVRNALRARFRSLAVSVSDGNRKNNRGKLFTDSKVYPIKPDVIFRSHKTILGLGEVKYKPKISETDRYQLISHSISSDAPVGIWISPANSGNDSGLKYIGSISSKERFYHYRLNISGNLMEACDDMFGKISSLLV